MKSLAFIAWFSVATLYCSAQYYIRGEVKNEMGKKLQNVRIALHSTDQIFYSGVEGLFGITTSQLHDTLTIFTEGYEVITKPVTATDFQQIILKALPPSPILKKNHLNSFIRNAYSETQNNWSVDDESYSELVENDFVKTTSAPVAVFSANINRASYSNIRRFLNMDEKVPPDAVRIEEMMNYFDFNYSAPPPQQTFFVKSILSSCPWNNDHLLLFLNISATKINLDNVPPGNFVLLIDVSGSMNLPNKLPLLKSGLRLLIKNLRDVDTVSIVTYGGTANILLEGVSGNEKDKMIKAIEQLNAEGATSGEAGIRLAYQVAKRRFIKDGNNRIILASDGDFNVGASSEKELVDLIDQQKESGIYLTCLGVGMGNYKDSKLSVLAEKGQGNFAYIDNEQEAEKIFVTELTKTLFAVADNVFVSVRFDSSVVRSYRLIGFDNTRTALADTSSKLEGGEIGSGYSSIALFELEPEESAEEADKKLADVIIRYHLPGSNKDKETRYQCTNDFTPIENADSSARKAATLAMFGMKLKGNKFASAITWKQVESMARKNFSEKINYENEFIDLIKKAEKIYSRKNKKKKNTETYY